MNLISQWPARSLMVVAEDQPLAALLRDSEPPAHTSWRPTAELARMRWANSLRHITDVRTAPGRVLALTSRRDEVIQRDVFTQLFPQPIPANPGYDINPGPKTKKCVKPPVPNPQPFRIADVPAGFEIRASRRSGAPEPASMLVRVAYDVPRGDAFAGYNPQDFRLHHDATVSVQTSGCRVVSDADDPPNELKIKVDDPAAFSLRLEGFDQNRDIYVRAVPQNSENPEDEDAE